MIKALKLKSRNKLTKKIMACYSLKYEKIFIIILITLFFVNCHSRKIYDDPSFITFDEFLERNDNRAKYDNFLQFLKYNYVSDVLPAEQLFRQNTDWHWRISKYPYAIPPMKLWKNIVPLLQFIKNELKPQLGGVEVVSGYRTLEFNERGGGVSKSQHIYFRALDLIPKNKKMKHTDLHKLLIHIWKKEGAKYKLGLGLYSTNRFHIDVFKYRMWKNKFIKY